MEVVASLSLGRTAAAQCGLFTYKSIPVIFEPPCMSMELLNSGPGSVVGIATAHGLDGPGFESR